MNDDTELKAKCAAGLFCTAPSHADLESSTHFCFECRGRIHCAMWCGSTLSDVRTTLTEDQLSSAGRASFLSSDHALLSICMVCITRLSSSPLDSSDAIESKSLPPENPDTMFETTSCKRKGPQLHDDLSSLLSEAKKAYTDHSADVEEEKEAADWKLISPGSSCVAKWWIYYKKFSPFAHPSMKDFAACTLCFEEGNCNKGTISIKGGGTGGIKRHLSNHHTHEFEKLDGGKSVLGGGLKGKGLVSAPMNSIITHLNPKERQLSLDETKALFVQAAASWAITEAVPFKMFVSPSFRKMFEPLNKNSSKIVNVDSLRI